MKKILKLLLIISVFAINTKKIFADNNYQTKIEITANEQDIKKMELEYERNFYEISKRTTGDYTTELVRVGSTTTGLSQYREAFSQPAAGTRFSTAGSGFYWADSSQTRGTFSVAVNIGGSIAQVSINYLPGTVQSGGVIAVISPNQVGKYVKLYVARAYSVTKYAVYKVNKYTGEKSFSHYQYASIPISRSFDIRNV